MCSELPCGATVATLETLADQFLTHEQVVEVAARPPGNMGLAGGVRRGDSRQVPAARADWRRYTTSELLELEAATLKAAACRHNDRVGVVTTATMNAALAAHSGLGRSPSGEQAAMLAALVTGGQGVIVINAAAGAGKTYTLRICQTAWRAAGFHVVGATLAAQAAQTLIAEGQIPAQTIARLLADLDHDGGFAPGTILVVDEAGMVGTRDLARLLDHAQRAGAKVVLVGDAEQLPEIEAGGLFRGLMAVLATVELTDNRRQVANWEQAALRQLRAGDVDGVRRAVAAYQDNGQLVVADTYDEVRGRLVDDWWRATRATASPPGQEPVMIAMRRADVADLNDLARARLRAAGRLGPDQLVVGGRAFAIGDRAVTLRNAARRFGVLNGTRGVVTGIDAYSGALEMRTDDGRLVRLPAGYLHPRGGRRHIDHAYALTGHKIQGSTVDQAYVLGGDELYRQWGYVALSRARYGTRLYLPAGSHVLDTELDRAPQPNRDAIQALVTALLDDRAQMLASAHPRRPAPTAYIPAAVATTSLDRRAQLRAHRGALARFRQEAAGWLAEVHDDAGVGAKHRAHQGRGEISRELVERRRFVARLDDDLAAVDRQLAVSAMTAESSRSRSWRISLGDYLERNPPRWLVAELGGRPRTQAARAAWRAAAVELSLYRARHRVRDPTSALGSTPVDPAGARQYETLSKRLHAARRTVETAEQQGVSGYERVRQPEEPGRWLDEPA